MPDVKGDLYSTLRIADCDFCGCLTNHNEFGKCERCHH